LYKGGKDMDKNPLIRKCLAVGIILLFVRTGILPTIAQDTGKTSLSTSTGKNQCFDTTSVPLPPPAGWIKTFGGTGYDDGYSVQQTTDGGYIITGFTESFGAGGRDVWLIKTNSNGDMVWNRTFGGRGDDWGYSVQQTIDGGYIITGYTDDAYLSDECEVWLIRADSNGNKVWDKTFGSTERVEGYSVQQTTDGGYIIAGTTYSGGIWLIKTDSNGEMMWNRTFTTVGWGGQSVQQTTDGGYIIIGETWSSDTGGEVWLIKTNDNGEMVWDRTFGGRGDDWGYSVQQTTDGGYIITGETWSFGGDVPNVWLIKTNGNGDEVWNKTYGGTKSDCGFSVRQTSDGGYIITGLTLSFGVGGDVWLIKTDGNGNKVWDKTFGGTEADWGKSVQQTTDGGYIIAGYTLLFHASYYDVLLIKTDKNGDINYPPNTPTITGKTNGTIITPYNYTIQTTDPDQDDVKYYIDWGDNTTTITGFNESGEEIIVSYTWNTKGTYNIQVKAIDINYAESDWATLTVTMPCSYKPIPQFLELLFQRFPHAFPRLRHLLEWESMKL